VATPNIPAGQFPEQDPSAKRWQSLQERCIALTGKTFPDLDADETMRVVNLLSTDDRSFALSHIGRFLATRNESKDSPTPEKPRRRKRQPPEERMTLAEAFMLGDDKDNERAVRAAALLLDWASDVGNHAVDGFLAIGISRALSLAAEQMARTARRAERERLEAR
jgi:hypothetical protein